jgi:cell division septation protein DedD
MTENTILVVDADKETEDKIVSTLEAEGYLVFTASGRNVSAGMAKKISFSLIYLKPTSSTIEGFETCRAIHKMEKFRNVPIVLLATLQGRVDPRYTTYYGIVDYLNMPLNPDVLIEKTRKILGISPEDIQKPEEAAAVAEQEAAAVEEPAGIQEEYFFDTDIQERSGTDQTAEDFGTNKEEDIFAENESEIQEAPAEGDETKENRQPAADHSYKTEEEKTEDSIIAEYKKEKSKGPGIKILLFAGITAIAILAGFFSYRLYFSLPAVGKPVVVKAPAVAVPTVKPQETIPRPPQEPQKPEPAAAAPAPAETVKEAPVKVKEIEPKGKPVHSVQLGAFKTESTAEAFANTYKSKGYEAFTQKGTTKDNEVIYRVLIGKFENRKEAYQLAAKIQTEEKAGTTVFSEIKQ